VREYTGWSLTQVHVQLSRLLEHEYVIAHRGGRGQSFVYELAYSGEGKAGEPFLVGLADVEALAGTRTTETYPGFEGTYPGQIRPNSASIPGGVLEPNSKPVMEEGFKTALAYENARLGTSDENTVVSTTMPPTTAARS
jgi:DNA primase